MKQKQIEPLESKATDASYPTPEMDELFRVIVLLETKEEAACFFRDLLTLPELHEFSNRWQTVKLLLEKMPYVSIAKKLGISTTTVTRVNHWLHHGTGGYQTAVRRTYLKNKTK